MCQVAEFGINSNFIHVIVDLAGYYSKGQKCHLVHYCFNPSNFKVTVGQRSVFDHYLPYIL